MPDDAQRPPTPPASHTMRLGAGLLLAALLGLGGCATVPPVGGAAPATTSPPRSAAPTTQSAPTPTPTLDDLTDPDDPALNAGAALPVERRAAIAEKLHQYTGLPVSYILKANLRIQGGEFEKNLQDEANLTTGRLDSRFSGPTLDPLSKEADYDPQSAAISSAYVSAFNDYVRKGLNYGHDRQFKPFIDAWSKWDFKHQPPGAAFSLGATNVMPDLAMAMKTNPGLKVLVLGGYFDLATPYFEGVYEMQHLPIPATLQANISYRYYQSGHMVYANAEALKQSHDDVAAFIRANAPEKK